MKKKCGRSTVLADAGSCSPVPTAAGLTPDEAKSKKLNPRVPWGWQRLQLCDSSSAASQGFGIDRNRARIQTQAAQVACSLLPQICASPLFPINPFAGVLFDLPARDAAEQ